MPKRVILHVPASIVSDKIVFAVDKAVIDLGLIVTMRGSLKSFPGSTHWHLKRGRERGTMEITWWPRDRRLWIKVQSGRTAAWIDRMTPQFKQEIQLRLGRLTHTAKSK